MNWHATAWIVLARQVVWEDLGSGFRGSRARFDAGDAATGLLLLAACAAGVLILSRLLSRQDRQRRSHRPRALFRSLCRAHGLSRSDRRCLVRLARTRGLTSLARLFVEPDQFATASASPQLRDVRPALERIGAQLFGSNGE